MHATYRAAILRENMLALAEQLNRSAATMVELAARHADTVVPNYTNGVAAQPNSYGHYLLGHAAGLARDAQRIREAYARIDRSPMGTTVLNGSSWPLDRKRMADYLGFAALVDNAYDASQISSMDEPVEVASIVTAISLHAGNFVQDIMPQYSQTRPWILLEEGGGNTYVSSAMPQKRNPGLLNSLRSDASTAVTLAMGPILQMHNITPGMPDPKEVDQNSAMVESAIKVLKKWDRVMKALVINRERALEELNSDWTASQELADVLMRKYQLPFRVGHHFASEIVTLARAKNIKPLDFPYAEARRIYHEAVQGSKYPQELPMNEAEFRATLDPVAIIQHRATAGGPQPAEMTRMLKELASAWPTTTLDQGAARAHPALAGPPGPGLRQTAGRGALAGPAAESPNLCVSSRFGPTSPPPARALGRIIDAHRPGRQHVRPGPSTHRRRACRD